MGIRFKVGVQNAAIVESDSEHPMMNEAQYLKLRFIKRRLTDAIAFHIPL
jgi:hypothetical protein